MHVHNLHVRRLAATEAEVGALIDTLSSDADLLWPHEHWPAMRFDAPLGVGAAGGHGPVRYRVVAYVPGQWVRFRFSGPRGFDGFHEYTVHRAENGTTELHHLLSMRAVGPARLTWPLIWGPLHDACLEDSLDRAEAATATVGSPARWSPYVRLLQQLACRLRRACDDHRVVGDEVGA